MNVLGCRVQGIEFRFRGKVSKINVQGDCLDEPRGKRQQRARVQLLRFRVKGYGLRV